MPEARDSVNWVSAISVDVPSGQGEVWDGDGHQLTAAPGLRHFQGIACAGKTVMLCVEFKERKTISKAGTLEEEISVRVGLDTLFG